MAYLAIAVGIAALVGSALAWAGKWKGWTRTFITAHLPVPVTILPAFGLQMVAAPLHEIYPSPATRFLFGSSLVVGLFAAIFAMWNPTWFGPAWFRELKRSGRPIDPDLSDPLTHITYAMAKRGIQPRAELPRPFQAKPVRHWRLSLVTSQGPRIGGHLELHEFGIAFYMNQIEARMAEKLVSITLTRAEIADVRVMPRRRFHFGGFGIQTRGQQRHHFEAFTSRRIVREIRGTLKL